MISTTIYAHTAAIMAATQTSKGIDAKSKAGQQSTNGGRQLFPKVPSASERPYFTTRTAIFAAIAEQIPWCKVSQATTIQAKA
jgi:hypothetical protein